MTVMVQIGKLTLDAPFFQAGLAGYSDAAMRFVARQHGCPYCITEAMLDTFLIRGGKGLAAAQLDQFDHPIAGQLMGSAPEDIAAGSKILADLGYDTIDINLACPVKKIRKKARGGHLLQEPDIALDILKAVRDAVPGDIPTTIKLRRGSDDSVEAERNFHRIFSGAIELGYSGIVVHGRSVEQKYIGPARWSFLRDLVNRYRDTPNFFIGGSGDIWNAVDIFRMIEHTGVDLVSVARGCIGNPWIFQQARAYMAGDIEGAHRPPTIDEQRNVLLTHFEQSMRLHGERMAGMMMRKFGIKFSRHHEQSAAVKDAFIKVKTLDEWRSVINTFYTQDATALVAT